MTMTIETRNFRVLRQTDWAPVGVCVVVGPNGAGKTTLLTVLEFLRNAYNRSASAAASFDSFGGGWGVRSWGSPEEEPVTMALSVGEVRWELQLLVQGGAVADQLGERLTCGTETWLSRLPYGDRIVYRGDERQGDSRLALRTIVDALQPPELEAIVRVVTGLRIHRGYNVHGLRMNGSRQGSDLYLNPTGENAFSVLRNWRDRRELRPQYDFVMQGLRLAFPEVFDDLDFHVAGLTITADFLDPRFGPPCPAALAPNGWLTGLLHLTAIAGARTGTFVGIDEFENTLHPYAIRQLTNVIREWADGRDLTVCLASHSPVLLDEFKEQPDRIFVMEGENRPVPLTELYEEDWLARFSLGRLYAHGEFGGQRGGVNKVEE